MKLSTKELNQLKRLIKIATALLASAEKPSSKSARSSKPSSTAIRSRRSGKELVAFQKMLKAERKRGVPVADLARQHNISSAYIYQIK